MLSDFIETGHDVVLANVFVKPFRHALQIYIGFVIFRILRSETLHFRSFLCCESTKMVKRSKLAHKVWIRVGVTGKVLSPTV